MKIFVISCTSFINLFCTPIAYGAIGWKYILVFVFWDAFEAVIWYFFCVETVGYTLEELQEIFEAPNPPKASVRMKKVSTLVLWVVRFAGSLTMYPKVAIKDTGDVLILEE